MAPADRAAPPPPSVDLARAEGSVAHVLAAATNRLRLAGSPSPRLDAEVLVAHVLGRDRAWVLARPEYAVTDAAAAQLHDWVARRSRGEPVAYIRGFKEWLSLRIRVDERALIPRPDTELLAETAMAEIARRLAEDLRPLVTWDVGTGSGAIPVALGLRFRTAITLGRIRLLATDASSAAVSLARENVDAHGLADLVELRVADLLAPAGRELPRPDVLVANLPYVASDEVDRLPVAASFEPRSALDGGADGLDVIRGLLAQLPAGLAPGGVALLEVGAGQADDVARIAAVHSLREVSRARDLAGVERVVAVGRG